MKKSYFRTGMGLFLWAILLASGDQAQKQGQQNKAITSDQALPAVTFKEEDEIPEHLRYETFIFVWEKIRDDYFDPDFGGVNWNKVKETYHPLVKEARTSGAFHALLLRMLRELQGSHLAILAPHQLTGEKKTADKMMMAPEGVEIRMAEGHVVVYTVKNDSPSWRAGLRPGQVILKAEGLSVEKQGDAGTSALQILTNVRKALAGEELTLARLTILDENDRTNELFLPRTALFESRANLARAKLSYRRVTPQVGYIWFDGWAFDLASKLEPAVRELWDTKGLIIDIRQNRGGVNPGVDYLSSVLNAEPGILAVVTRRNRESENWTYPGGGERVYKGRVAILIDECSGSASEVFAGAMQEMKRAAVLGKTSYGGVLNSTQVALPTGGILQYPHSDMRTPKGRRIEGLGIVPDIPVELLRKDLFKGKDTVIEKAIQVVSNK